MASWFDKLQGKKQGGLGSLFPGKGGERIKPLPPTRRPLEQPGTWLVPPDRPIEAPVMPIGPRPPIGGPDGPMPPRPPGISLAALKRKRQQLREQLRQIEAQILSLGRERPIRDPWDFGGEPPPPPLNPPTIVRPPSIGPGTPIPQPPTPPTPWKPDPPRGG